MTANTWREVKLVFHGEEILITLNDKSFSHTLKRTNFNVTKRKLLWMQNGGDQGLELDDIHVMPTVIQPESLPVKHILSLLIALLFTPLTGLQAAQLHGLFTHNMVLQREKPLAIYGTGDDGEKVTVELNGQRAVATVVNGEWKAVLPAMKAGGPYTMTVTGKQALTLQNIMLGDVWLCTGQSNMAGMLKTYKGDGYRDYQHLYTGIPQANR